jgi:hypothetical protein
MAGFLNPCHASRGKCFICDNLWQKTMKRFCRNVLDLSVVLICVAAILVCGCTLCANRTLSRPELQQPTQLTDNISDSPAAVSPMHRAALHVSHWLYAAGVICLLACGACAWLGQGIPAVKFGLAGICLPVIAAWFSVYWAWLVSGILVALAIHWLLMHRSLVSPLEKRIAGLERFIGLEAGAMTKP